MRRSCAPSMKNKPTSHSASNKSQCVVSSSQTQTFGRTSFPREHIVSKENVSSSTNLTSNTTPIARQGKQLIFNAVWREVTNKKQKTWKGDGTFEVQLDTGRAVFKDDTGKYMGSSSNFKVHELAEGFQMKIGGKEIELQEQVTDMNDFWARRKLQIASRTWGEEECPTWEEPVKKKPKGDFFFRPNLVMNMAKMTNTPKRRTQLTPPPKVTTNDVNVEPLILTTPDDTPQCKYNKHNRPVHQVNVSSVLVKHLRPHQREGVAFLYSCLMGFRHQQRPDYTGCILADEMGLGKTLQCLTVAHTMLRSGPFAGERVIQRALIVTPSSLTGNWQNEINKWLQTERIYAFVVDNKKHKLSSYSQQQHVPFVIVSYETLLSQAEDFLHLEFDLLICDEGHRLKNQTTKIFTALRDLNIRRRVILTGTPLQNDLQEFFALADFVNPGIFGTYQEFRKHFELPLKDSQCPAASEEIKQLAAERTGELNEISSTFLLRRLQQVNRQYLPKKREYICFVRPSELQQMLLQKALELYARRRDTILKDLSPLQIITILKKICNHPSLIARTKSPNLLTRNLERYLPDWSDMGPFDSAKLELVQNFLSNTVVGKREKCVLVSNHTKTLNMLQGLCDHLQLKCLRLDGATVAAERQANVETFNSTDTNSEDVALVFLLSAKAGGVGLNLIGASRLILFDNDWNPATDAQAMARIWRDGQRKDVQIYRLVTAGCIEEKIFQRQVAKMSLGDCVMQTKTNNDSMKFSAEELLDLFTLQLDFDTCQTHASLNCSCAGDGQNLVTFDKDDKQINELMQWSHHQAPFDDKFLEEACLDNASENLAYIFANQTELV